MAPETTRTRGLFLLPAGLSMLAGLDAGLLRAGLPAPARGASLADRHGMLMALGFLGTVIALERAVALRETIGYAAPLLLGLGGLLLAAGASADAAALLLAEGAIALALVLLALYRRSSDPVVLAQGIAAVCALVAVVAWHRSGMPAAVPALAAYLVLTIAAERIELARLTMPASAGTTLAVGACLTLVALPLVWLWPATVRGLGLAVIVLVAWLVRADVARHTVRATGLPRYSAAAMLLGYAWLGLAGVLWVLRGHVGSGGAYDAIVHAVFVGFGLSMVMAHAPVILPAVLRRPLPYRAVLWLPLAALHLTLAVRVGGDLQRLLDVDRISLWRSGVAGTAVALLLFVLTAAAVAATAPTRRKHP
ncbi:MAG: hypothetical protein LWW86_07960 [Micrococcales bacterium]|nr:hypothetical protein [Micrococcales bacterium]